MYYIPRIKIELEGIRSSVQHMFNAKNTELNDMIIAQLDKTLSEEWVMNNIKKEVHALVTKAIADISNNYALRDAISELVAKNIESLIRNKKQNTK